MENRNEGPPKHQVKTYS